jgi:predicted phage terminase large subunit-like protein
MPSRSEAAAELLARRQDRRESESLAEFAKRAWHVLEPGRALKWGWCLDAVCEHLEAAVRGDIQKLAINVPPGCMKSLLTAVILPAWVWGPAARPSTRYIGTSHALHLATRDNLKCRRLIKSPWYQNRWKVPLMADQDAKTKFENSSTGFREAMSFTSMTGSRGDIVGVDDPLSADGANSDEIRKNVATTFTESLPSRGNDPDESVFILIMQRLHEADPTGLIIEHDLDWDLLILPMEFEADRRCTTSIGFTDPRTKEGELLFPERFSAQAVASLKKELSAEGGEYAVSGQLQQSPIPRGGSLFRREDFCTIPAAPVGTVWARGWDLAGTKKKHSPYTAGVLIGRAPSGRTVIGDARRKQENPTGVERMLVNTGHQDAAQYGTVYGSGPQDPGQAGKAQAQYLMKKLAGLIYEFTPETGDKVTRAMPLSSQVGSGNVDLVAGDWNKEYLDEMCSFPRGKFADQVDASSRAFSRLQDAPHYNLDGVE